LWDTKDEKKPETLDKFQNKILPQMMEKYCNIIRNNVHGKFLVGKNLTYADIYVVSILDYITGRLTLEPGEFSNSHPTHNYSACYLEYRKRVLNQPGIKKWIEKRPILPY
jgi:glutathione S-transferase